MFDREVVLSLTDTPIIPDIENVSFKTPTSVIEQKSISGGFATVNLVVDKRNVRAARKSFILDFQSFVTKTSSTLCNEEIKLLNAVSGVKHMPVFLGSLQCKDILYMYYTPWGHCSLETAIYNPRVSGLQIDNKWNTGAQWILCLASALQSFHELSPPIMHRDIKPVNIIVLANNEVCLIDFGVGKLLEHPQLAKSYAGTKDYMSPEINSFNNYRRTAEVFSLGCVFFEIITFMCGVDVNVSFEFKPYAKRLDKVSVYLQTLSRKFASIYPNLPIFAQQIELMSLNPIDRPAFWEVHHVLRDHGTFTCCFDDIAHSKEDSVSDMYKWVDEITMD